MFFQFDCFAKKLSTKCFKSATNSHLEINTVKPRNSGHLYGQDFSTIEGFSTILKVKDPKKRN